jgi:hypothetical protein
MITRSFSRPLEVGARQWLHARAGGTRACSPTAVGPDARVRVTLAAPAWAGSAPREQAEEATASSNYWSASTDNNNPDNAWNVNFNNGNTNNNNKNNNNQVRAVRGGS